VVERGRNIVTSLPPGLIASQDSSFSSDKIQTVLRTSEIPVGLGTLVSRILEIDISIVQNFKGRPVQARPGGVTQDVEQDAPRLSAS
jgi:hypothetical protein